MKRALPVLFIVMLLFQTVASSMMLPQQVRASTLDDAIFGDIEYLNEDGDVIKDMNKEKAVQMKVNWSFKGVEVEADDAYQLPIPAPVEVAQNQDGLLLVEDQEVGTYEASQGNGIVVTLNESVLDHPEAKGDFLIDIIDIEAEKAEAAEAEKDAEPSDETAEPVEEDGEEAGDTSSDESGTEEAAPDESAETPPDAENTDAPAEEEESLEESEPAEEAADADAEKSTEGEKAAEDADAEEDGKVEEPASDESAEEEKATEEEKAEESVEASAKRVGIQSVDGVIEENILTSAELSYEDENGNPLDAATPDALISIDYTWALPNGHGYKGGDVFSFTVPDELDIYEEINDSEMKFNGETIGYFSVTKDGQATVEFTEFIEQFSNIEGTLQIWTELDEQTVITEDKEIHVTLIEGQDEVTIPIDFTPGGSAVEKQGEADRAYNAESIEWTVDFNKTLQTLTNASLSDPIQSGQELEDGSIKLYHLDTKLNGEVSLGEEVAPSAYTIGKTGDDKDFAIQFNDDIKSAYRLVYSTTLTDQDQAQFTNDATLYSGSDNKGTASTTVNVGRGTALAKRAAGYDRAKQEITWEIKYNYNEKTIASDDAVLNDLFNESQDLLMDSFEVVKVTIDAGGNESNTEAIDPSTYTITETSEDGKKGFNFQFNDEITSAYKIVYKTKASERVYDSEQVNNTVRSGDKDASAERGISQQILFKGHGTPNYKDKTIGWTIRFNEDSQEMNNVVLNDVFTNSGLTLQEDSIVINDGETTLVEGNDYVIVKNEADEFEIQFLNTITTPHTLTYTTAFDYEQRADTGLNYLSNKVNLTWNDANGDDQAKAATSNFTPDEFTQFNGFKNGSYNAVDKEITWNIGVNYNLKSLTSASVEDYIKGNQQLIEGSITVYKMNLTGGQNGTEVGEAVEGTDFDIEMVESDDGEPGFRITFLNNIDTAYKVTYKTSLNGLEKIDAQYSNTAVLYDGGKQETSLDASVSIPYGGSYTGKQGTQNGKVIDWKVNINFAQAEITNATITDNPSNNQSLLDNSFVLYATEVAANGTVTKGEALEEGKDYTLAIEHDPEKFVLTFNDTIDGPYILEYKSLILDRVGANVNNSVSFNGEQIDVVENESSGTITVRRTSGSGDGTGEIGRLTVIKQSAQSGEALPGAEFILLDSDSGTEIARGTTEDDGTLIFDRLLYGSYQLVEEKAPEGHLKAFESKDITIDTPYEAGDESKKGNEEIVKNAKITRDVQLTKVDEETNDVLEGAVFKLVDADGNTIEEGLTTNEEGMFIVRDLAPGDYAFVETKAPEGYEKNEREYPVTIDENQITVKEVTAENEIIKGSVELLKIGEEEEPLEGAEFKLLDSEGNEVQTELVTGEDGKMTVNDLRPGNYAFVETKAPFGHELDETPVPFEIIESQQETIQVEMGNERSMGSFELTKVGEDGKLLEGVTYELQDENGETIQADLKTMENGVLRIDDLKPGKYQLVETASIDGYIIDPTPVPFEIAIGDKLKTAMVVNDLKTGSVELTKTGEGAEKLQGAVFNLLDADGEMKYSNLVTDENGMIYVDDLKPGAYQFVEVDAPFGYVLDESPVSFTMPFNPTEVVKVDKDNSQQTSGFELTKTGEGGETLEGVVFELQDASGETIAANLVTDENGKITRGGLKPGIYQLVETETNDGYQLMTGPETFEIELGQTALTAVDIENEYATGSVELTKLGEEEEVLEGAEFKLLDKAGEIVEEGLVTDESGKIVVEDLKPGNYQFIETKAPFGHDLNEEAVSFEIVFDQQEVLNVEKSNERTTSAVELIKTGEDGKTLEGVVYELQNEAGETLHEDLVTDKAGKVYVEGLKPGTYQFVETSTIPGYDLDATPIVFDIELGQTEATPVDTVNELTTGSVELTKIGEAEEALEGAEFKLLDESGEVVEEGLMTDAEGKIVVEDLKPGIYQFIETKAPFGHDLDTEPVTFEIEFNQQEVLTIEKSNERTTGAVEINKTGEDGKTLAGVTYELQDENGETLRTDLQTDAEGVLTVEDLKPGKYQLVETASIPGYDIDSTPIPFEIELGQESAAEVSAVNALTTGSVELTKVGEKAERLQGAAFKLLDEEGNEIHSNLITDEQG
ncbi:UNVERIFIED_CONTAM: SpaA isopeptide-forming pilin-related protein, partial [Halobacillus marinus]